MRIHLIAVGQRMPAWVQQGFSDYSKRMPRECQLVLKEIEPAKRVKSTSTERIKQDEAKRLLAAIPKGSLVVALDERGSGWSTAELSSRLDDWLARGGDVALLVGGADGLDAQVLSRADLKWSLSNLVLPHPLVRIVIAEQIYRAWSLLQGHPYHRA